jgi:hypothetical protein
MKTRAWFWVVTWTVLMSASSLSASEPDNLICYNITDTQVLPKQRIELEDAFGDQTCLMERQARLACIPATKLLGAGDDPKGDETRPFLCYDTTRCTGNPPRRVDVADEYWVMPTNPVGFRNIEIEKSRFLCVPADFAPAS